LPTEASIGADKVLLPTLRSIKISYDGLNRFRIRQISSSSQTPEHLNPRNYRALSIAVLLQIPSIFQNPLLTLYWMTPPEPRSKSQLTAVEGISLDWLSGAYRLRETFPRVYCCSSREHATDQCRRAIAPLSVTEVFVARILSSFHSSRRVLAGEPFIVEELSPCERLHCTSRNQFKECPCRSRSHCVFENLRKKFFMLFWFANSNISTKVIRAPSLTAS
jgi:hypothetical protein